MPSICITVWRKSLGRANPRRLFEACVLIGGLTLLVYSIAARFNASAADPTVSPSLDENAVLSAEPPQDKDYSRFTHGNEFHSRLPCLLCHRRDDNSPRMRFPGKSDHLPCAGCHALQFSDPGSPICTICHTNAQAGAMKRFPPLRSFNARFNHSRHSRVNCNTCHKPQGRGGVAKDIPSGSGAHVTCFQCHTNRSAFSMSSCNVCHQPGRLSRTPETSRAFRIGFSHSRHAAEGLACSSCHTVRAGAARGRQVSAPATAMHFASARAQSCASCHNSKRAFGTETFANCRKCHQGSSFSF